MTPDVLPKLLIEMRADAAVIAIAGTNPTSSPARVRGFEPEPAIPGGYDGDAHGHGEFRAFVVLVQLDAPRLARAPVQRPTIVARCYGRTHAEAAALRWACSDAIHALGPRVHTNGLGIYLSLDTSGGDQELDPDTQQPLQTFVIDAFATTQAVAV